MYGKLIKREDHLINLEFRTHLTFEVRTKDLKEIPEHCELSFTQWSPDRTIDQNAKYWVLVGQIAKLGGIQKAVVHNMLLADYGELEMKDGEPIEVVLPESYDYLSDRDLHLFPTGKTIRVGDTLYVIYYKLKDSKSLTQKQFHDLIEGAKQELEAMEGM